MKKPISLLLLLALMLSLFAGCAAPTPAVTPAVSGPITLTDQTGREVTLAAPAEKIVSGYYISTSACVALGLTDKLVGIEKKIIGLYKLAVPALLELPNVGTAKAFDLEGCLALNPDLVILPKKLKDAAQTLTEHGVPTLLVNPENQTQLVEMLNLIGKATGTEATAEQLVATYEASAAKLETLNKTLTEAQKPVVYMGGNGALLTTAPKEMYQATLIRMGGGINAGDSLDGDSWTEVSYEQVLAMNPDVIILPSDASYTVDDVKNDPQLSEVTAIKNGAVSAMPNELEAWDSPVPSCCLGSEWMMYTLHPELISKDEMMESIKAFYQTFYHFEIGTVLNLR